MIQHILVDQLNFGRLVFPIAQHYIHPSHLKNFFLNSYGPIGHPSWLGMQITMLNSPKKFWVLSPDCKTFILIHLFISRFDFPPLKKKPETLNFLTSFNKLFRMLLLPFAPFIISSEIFSSLRSF